MSINVINVEVKDNPAPFTAPFQFEITFDCSAPGIPDGTSHSVILRHVKVDFMGCADLFSVFIHL